MNRRPNSYDTTVYRQMRLGKIRGVAALILHKCHHFRTQFNRQPRPRTSWHPPLTLREVWTAPVQIFGQSAMTFETRQGAKGFLIGRRGNCDGACKATGYPLSLVFAEGGWGIGPVHKKSQVFLCIFIHS